MIEATVEARHGHRLLVLPEGGPRLTAVTRGRRNDITVGDRVEVRELGAGQAVIETVLPRRNLVQRSDAWRAKPLAANVDQVAVVIAPSPRRRPASLANASATSSAVSIAALPILISRVNIKPP